MAEEKKKYLVLNRPAGSVTLGNIIVNAPKTEKDFVEVPEKLELHFDAYRLKAFDTPKAASDFIKKRIAEEWRI